MILNPGRSILAKFPGLNGVVDKLAANINGLLMAEHNQDGSHGVITERGRTVALGVWTDIPYAAANYTASGAMTWTVALADQASLRYILIGRTCTVQFRIQLTTVGGGGSSALQLTLPDALKADGEYNGVFAYGNVANVGVGHVFNGGTNKTRLIFNRDFSGTNWDVTGTDDTYIFGQHTFGLFSET